MSRYYQSYNIGRSMPNELTGYYPNNTINLIKMCNTTHILLYVLLQNLHAMYIFKSYIMAMRQNLTKQKR